MQEEQKRRTKKRGNFCQVYKTCPRCYWCVSACEQCSNSKRDVKALSLLISFLFFPFFSLFDLVFFFLHCFIKPTKEFIAHWRDMANNSISTECNATLWWIYLLSTAKPTSVKMMLFGTLGGLWVVIFLFLYFTNFMVFISHRRT